MGESQLDNYQAYNPNYATGESRHINYQINVPEYATRALEQTTRLDDWTLHEDARTRAARAGYYPASSDWEPQRR